MPKPLAINTDLTPDVQATNALPISLPPYGLTRPQAAEFVGRFWAISGPRLLSQAVGNAARRDGNPDVPLDRSRH